MAERFTPNGARLSSDTNPPRERNVVLAELIAGRIYDLSPKVCSMSGDVDYRHLTSALKRMLDAGEIHAKLEGE